MKKSLSLSARSPLGTWIALAAMTAILLILGLEIAHQATDGTYYTKTTFMNGPVLARAQQPTDSFLTTLTERMKKYERPDLLTRYGAAVFVGFLSVTLLGGLIRSYRFRFVASRSDPAGGYIERRAMWMFLPLLWFVRLWRRMWTVIPVRALRNFRIPLMDLYIPGMKKRIPFSRAKRLEIQSGAEGGTALVLTFRDERTWTLRRGRQKRLQRLGGIVARAVGLERRDMLTWA